MEKPTLILESQMKLFDELNNSFITAFCAYNDGIAAKENIESLLDRRYKEFKTFAFLLYAPTFKK